MTTRLGSIQHVLLVTLGLNVAVATAKLTVGTMSSSVALWADGLHSLLDGSSNIVALIGIWVAHRPPDTNHPYGHRKFEAVAALANAPVLFIASLEVQTAAHERIRGGAEGVQKPHN
jgi:cation diffusion facilitator family transporter